jgi:hypothetical protein
VSAIDGGEKVFAFAGLAETYALSGPKRDMLVTVGKWLGLAVLLVGLAVGVNTLVPALSGHLAIGVAALIVVVLLYAAQSLGIKRLP